MKSEILFSSKYIIRVTLVFASIMVTGVFNNNLYSQNGSWVAPKSADSYKNPFSGDEKAAVAGKKLYTKMCAICHGNKGKGDGIAGMALQPRPSNFTKDDVQNQTDGAIFWKMTVGKAPMASYKETLTEEQRWQLVAFIKSLGK